jgi:hypothetical protein
VGAALSEFSRRAGERRADRRHQQALLFADRRALYPKLITAADKIKDDIYRAIRPVALTSWDLKEQERQLPRPRHASVSQTEPYRPPTLDDLRAELAIVGSGEVRRAVDLVWDLVEEYNGKKVVPERRRDGAILDRFTRDEPLHEQIFKAIDRLKGVMRADLGAS